MVGAELRRRPRTVAGAALIAARARREVRAVQAFAGQIDRTSWETPEVFRFLQKQGKVAEAEESLNTAVELGYQSPAVFFALASCLATDVFLEPVGRATFFLADASTAARSPSLAAVACRRRPPPSPAAVGVSPFSAPSSITTRSASRSSEP